MVEVLLKKNVDITVRSLVDAIERVEIGACEHVINCDAIVVAMVSSEEK